MPTRRLRFLAGHYYHIYNRGVNRDDIFFSPGNYTYLLQLFKQHHLSHGISIAAYCLLPNHYHLLLRPERDHTLSPFLQTVFSAYVQAVNAQKSREGPLFQGRFRAVWVDDEDYFVHVARYIHANPVQAGLVDACETWPYSNYLDIIGRRNGSLRTDDLVPVRFATGEAYQASVEDYVAFRREVRGLRRYLLE